MCKAAVRPWSAGRALVLAVGLLWGTGCAASGTPGPGSAARAHPQGVGPGGTVPARSSFASGSSPASSPSSVPASGSPPVASPHPSSPLSSASQPPASATPTGRSAAAPSPTAPPARAGFLRGITYAGYTATVFATATSDALVRQLAATGANAVSVQTAWYQATPRSTHIAPTNQTPSDASLVHLIRLIHQLHMRVFLDPFVNATTGEAWQGAFHPRSWAAWFRSYDAEIAHYARLAQANGVEMLAIGDENDTSDHNPALLPDYLHLIAVARAAYSGPLTYGADYPDYRQIPAAFWRRLNAIGLEAYFPLAAPASAHPSQSSLDAAWRRQAARIAAWRQASGLTPEPVVITELGYYSARSTAASPGAWQPRSPLDLRLQAECYRATLSTIYQEPWLHGLFWFWWANPSDGPDWPATAGNNGYNLQDKPALGVLESYFRAPHGGRPAAAAARGGP